MTSRLTLHGYWRSGAAYRVRIALSLKRLPYESRTHDLRTGAQRDPAYLAHNPQGLVPTLETQTIRLTQSPAILEWLDERYPVPPLLPTAPDQRAIVRSMAAIVCCDIHPLNNLRVLNALRQDLGASEAQVSRWIGGWITSGFEALERAIETHGGAYSVGDSPTLADCCLVPQVYSARRFAVDLSAFPRITAVDHRCGELEAFAQARPEAQADAPT